MSAGLLIWWGWEISIIVPQWEGRITVRNKKVIMVVEFIQEKYYGGKCEEHRELLGNMKSTEGYGGGRSKTYSGYGGQ